MGIYLAFSELIARLASLLVSQELMSFVFIVFMFLPITLISHKEADVLHSIPISHEFLDFHNGISKHKLKISANKASSY